MRAVLQRVSEAQVETEGSVVASIGTGLLVLLCAVKGDEDRDVDSLARFFRLTVPRGFDTTVPSFLCVALIAHAAESVQKEEE